jgi:hypothetical protein
MVFKNETELKNFLMKKCRNALVKSQQQVYQIIDRFVKEYYAYYSPEMYERTYQLYRSLVKSDIVATDNGYEAKVYFDLSSLDYVTGGKPSGEQVMTAAKEGWHGAVGKIPNSDKYYKYVVSGGEGIWDEPKQILDAQAKEILKKMLISEGIPIK